jgi:coenzyme PQQ biosynthesis protein PqqD
MFNRITSATARPQLRSKVRLRVDPRTGHDILLYPERGLELNQTGTEIARLCTGVMTIADIEHHLARRYSDISPDEIRREVLYFLNALVGRGLIVCHD